MVNEQLRVHTKLLIQQRLIMKVIGFAQRTPCHIAHGVKPQFFQPPGVAPAYPPKICQRPMIPEVLPIAHFIQLGDPDAVLIRLHMLGHNVHCHLAKIEVCTNARGGCDAGIGQHILDHPGSQLPGCQAIGFQIGCGIDEHLIDGIYMDILRCHIF